MAADTTPTAAPTAAAKAKPAWYLRFRYLLPLSLLLIVTMATVFYDDPSKEDVSRADFEAAGLTWPLTVDAGEIECERGNWVTFKPEGSEIRYALNGLAKATPLFTDLDAIWAPDPNVAGLKVSAEDLTDAALALC